MKQYNEIEQGTEEWHHLRKGKITGTTLESIMGTPKARQEAMYEIIAERLTVGVEREMDYENPMDRGNRLEPEALAMFEIEHNVTIDRTGFCEHDDQAFIANSPDGLIGETEAVEVKCPQGKNYVKMWLTNEVPKDYQWQTIQYFVVNEKLEKLYFVGYNPEIPMHPLHVIEVKRESIKDLIEQARIAQDEFLKEINEKLQGIIEF